MAKDRKDRQRNFFIRVTISFILFSLLWVPLQFHVEWYRNLYLDLNNDWFNGTMKSAPLYFYAVVLCIEANLKLGHYPQIFVQDKRMIYLKWMLWVPVILFGAQFFVAPVYRSGDELPNFEIRNQFIAALVAFIGSLIAHIVLANKEKRRIT